MRWTDSRLVWSTLQNHLSMWISGQSKRIVMVWKLSTLPISPLNSPGSSPSQTRDTTHGRYVGRSSQLGHFSLASPPWPNQPGPTKVLAALGVHEARKSLHHVKVLSFGEESCFVSFLVVQVLSRVYLTDLKIMSLLTSLRLTEWCWYSFNLIPWWLWSFTEKTIWWRGFKHRTISFPMVSPIV